MKKKRIAAWICLAVIAVLILSTFVVALLDFPGSDIVFRSLLAATVLLPILVWLYIWIFQKVRAAKNNRSGEESVNPPQ